MQEEGARQVIDKGVDSRHMVHKHTQDARQKISRTRQRCKTFLLTRVESARQRESKCKTKVQEHDAQNVKEKKQGKGERAKQDIRFKGEVMGFYELARKIQDIGFKKGARPRCIAYETYRMRRHMSGCKIRLVDKRFEVQDMWTDIEFKVERER